MLDSIGLVRETKYVYSHFKFKCTGQDFGNDNDGEGATCKLPGNAKCNPSTWDKYEGYHDACCSDLEKCGIDEGDCNSDSECLGSLICLYNGCAASQGFDERASCCQQPSATFKMGMNRNIFTYHSYMCLRRDHDEYH